MHHFPQADEREQQYSTPLMELNNGRGGAIRGAAGSVGDRPLD
jgi:hypothetical protein